MSNIIIRYAAAGTAALSLGLLGACGQGSGGGVRDEGKGEVASIETPAASDARNTASAGEGSEEGVQLRVDMTEAEQEAVWQSYYHCLKEHGVPTYSKKRPPLSGQGPDLVLPSGGPDKYPDGYKACESKKPIQPPELDPGKNPHYMDDYRAWIKCMNDKGFAVDPLPDGSGWTHSERRGRVDPGSKQAVEVDHDCQVEAFSGGE